MFFHKLSFLHHLLYSITIKIKKIKFTIMVIIFSDFLMFDQIFLSPQVKLVSVITSNKHGIYKLPHELSNDLRHRILGN